jgi:hypothetical protein
MAQLPSEEPKEVVVEEGVPVEMKESETITAIPLTTTTSTASQSLPAPHFTDVANDPILPELIPVTSTLVAPTEQQLVGPYLYQLLECLHVFHKYTLVTGKLLPPELEFFCKSLLGVCIYDEGFF